ncbi:MAG: hypothetical protein F6K11_20030 [Leptolyngbya sp. SIO3F4]|nr:hypothetical protein [Leptolyngbya sp. SIO3F4]
MAGEAYGPKLSEAFGGGSPAVASNGHSSNGHSANGNSPISHEAVLEKITPPRTSPIDTNPASISDILEDEDIDPDVLDDF